MRFTPFLIALLSYLNLQAQEPYFLNGEFYDEVDQVMKSFVKDGTVDYSGLLEEPALFNNIMGHLDHAELEGLEDASKKAFYLNAYNLTVIKSVLLEYPIASPEEVPGFFREQKTLDCW